MRQKMIQMLQAQIDYLIDEMYDSIEILYLTNDICTTNRVLNYLWSRAFDLQYLNELLEIHLSQIIIPIPPSPISPVAPPTPPTPPVPAVPPTPPSMQPQLPTKPLIPEKTFTIEELKTFNGKDGNPAYIAVNGLVYDVTNNAAWAAATHFGLTAGNDLTQEFQSCHPGQERILNQLIVVGRLVS